MYVSALTASHRHAIYKFWYRRALLYIYELFLMRKKRCLSCAVYHCSRIKVYKRPHYGSQLEPEHVTVNQLMNLLLCVTDRMHVIFLIGLYRFEAWSLT